MFILDRRSTKHIFVLQQVIEKNIRKIMFIELGKLFGKGIGLNDAPLCVTMSC